MVPGCPWSGEGPDDMWASPVSPVVQESLSCGAGETCGKKPSQVGFTILLE